MEKKSRIGIMGAMSEEVEHLKKLMTIEKETHIGQRTYYSGSINNTNVTLVLIKQQFFCKFYSSSFSALC